MTSDGDDIWTQSLVGLLLRIAQAAQEHDKQYYIGGGFAIDLAFGGITRWHEDIDFHPDETDTEWWKEWFDAAGYVISREPDMEPFPNAFLLTNSKHDYIADVYPVMRGTDGAISLLKRGGTHEVWPGKSWKTIRQVDYNGRVINLEDYRTVLRQKEDYIRQNGGTLSEKHLHDFERAGVKPNL